MILLVVGTYIMKSILITVNAKLEITEFFSYCAFIGQFLNPQNESKRLFFFLNRLRKGYCTDLIPIGEENFVSNKINRIA